MDPRPDSALVRMVFGIKYVRAVGYRLITTYQATLPEGMTLRFHTRDETEKVQVKDILRKGVYDKFMIPEGGTVVDVGANVGLFTIKASKLVGPQGMVVSVEPSPPSFSLLEKNIILNSCKNVKPFMIALSDKESFLNLKIHRSSVLNSLVEREETPKGYVKVQTKTLDGLAENLNLTRLDILKIDTEGSELPILKGSAETIRRFKPYIVGEAHPGFSDSGSKIAEFLEGFGYECELTPRVRDAQMFYADPRKPSKE